jgi:hypothetical protein
MYAGDVMERSKILRRHPQGRYGTLPWRHEPSIRQVNLGDYWWVTSGECRRLLIVPCPGVIPWDVIVSVCVRTGYLFGPQAIAKC